METWNRLLSMFWGRIWIEINILISHLCKGRYLFSSSQWNRNVNTEHLLSIVISYFCRFVEKKSSVFLFPPHPFLWGIVRVCLIHRDLILGSWIFFWIKKKTNKIWVWSFPQGSGMLMSDVTFLSSELPLRVHPCYKGHNGYSRNISLKLWQLKSPSHQ